MATATAGIQSNIDVENVPVIPTVGSLSKPHVWTWIWFLVAVFVVLGFHVRVFGHPVPPSANFP